MKTASPASSIRALTSRSVQHWFAGLATATVWLALAHAPATAQQLSQAAPPPGQAMTAGSDPAAQTQTAAQAKTLYVMFRNVVDRSKMPAAAAAHARWIGTLEQSGRVFASGPTFAADGGAGVGITVFRVAGFDEATALAAGDPFVLAGAATFDIRRWQLN